MCCWRLDGVGGEGGSLDKPGVRIALNMSHAFTCMFSCTAGGLDNPEVRIAINLVYACTCMFSCTSGGLDNPEVRIA